MNYDPQIIKSQQDFVRAVDKHGMPIDFAGEEPQVDKPLWIAAIAIIAMAAAAAFFLPLFL